MTKTSFILGAIVSAVCVIAVFGFGAWMASESRAWAAEHRMLSVLIQTAVNAGSFIQTYPLAVSLAVVTLCFFAVWLAGRIIVKG